MIHMRPKFECNSLIGVILYFKSKFIVVTIKAVMKHQQQDKFLVLIEEKHQRNLFMSKNETT